MFPKITLPIKITKSQHIKAAKQALLDKKPIIMVSQKTNNNMPKLSDIYTVGVLCNVIALNGNDRTDYEVVVEGVEKVIVDHVNLDKEIFTARAKPISDVISKETTKSNLLFNALKDKIFKLSTMLDMNFHDISQIEEIDDANLLSNYASLSELFSVNERQALLEELHVNARIEKLLSMLNKIVDELNIQNDIAKRTTDKLTKGQREAYLRQQLEEIKRELGEDSPEQKEENSFAKRISKSHMPSDVKKIAQDELKKLETVQTNSAEYNVIRNYLEWLVSMPWGKETTEEIDIPKVKAQLDQDHFGLDKVKRRILEYLAVNKLRKGQLNSPIVCLVGPPGVGKTSLGASIAKAINRQFIRVSLGGVKDESEIRGHRRTYVGAMPGKIVQNLKRVQSSNPLMLLDEIDKLSSSYNGDPSSALLEVLDPEQNKTFVDHYLDVSFDLSKILFIATANDIENIPGPLRDRMEIIYVSSYTSIEKFNIAKKYLIPTVTAENGVDESMLEIQDLSLMKIINHYTKESGVRQLKRHIATISRAAAINWLEKSKKTIVDEKALVEILGSPFYEKEKLLEIMEPGVINGLAWTPFGGDLLFIETSLFKQGAGRIQLTGQLGGIMKESALIALSYIRSNYESLNIEPEIFNKCDFYIHVPSGAVKKDGPSAGVTLFTSMVSVLTGRSVSNQVAMTGEITLKGQVTAVGGIKEKIIAAHESGVKTIYLSKQNEKDVIEYVPAEVKKDLTFIYVTDLKELYNHLFPNVKEEVVKKLKTEAPSASSDNV